jgi:hypothetical protein
MNEWIASEVNSEKETLLQHYAYDMREKAEAEYYRAAVREHAALLIASQGPDEEPFTGEQAEGLADLLLRSRALEGARYALCETPDVRVVNRWGTVAALGAANSALTEESDAYRREIGFKDRRS